MNKLDFSAKVCGVSEEYAKKYSLTLPLSPEQLLNAVVEYCEENVGNKIYFGAANSNTLYNIGDIRIDSDYNVYQYENDSWVLQGNIKGENGESLNPMGEWVSDNEYHPLDLVSYEGSSYVCKIAINSSKTPPPNDLIHWQVSAEKPDLNNYAQINGNYPELGAGYLAKTKAFTTSSVQQGWIKIGTAPMSTVESYADYSCIMLIHGIFRGSSTNEYSPKTSFIEIEARKYITSLGDQRVGVLNGDIPAEWLCFVIEDNLDMSIYLYNNYTERVAFTFEILSEHGSVGGAPSNLNIFQFPDAITAIPTAPDGAVYSVNRNIPALFSHGIKFTNGEYTFETQITNGNGTQFSFKSLCDYVGTNSAIFFRFYSGESSAFYPVSVHSDNGADLTVVFYKENSVQTYTFRGDTISNFTDNIIIR